MMSKQEGCPEKGTGGSTHQGHTGSVLNARRYNLNFILYVMGNDMAEPVFQKVMSVAIQRTE